MMMCLFVSVCVSKFFLSLRYFFNLYDVLDLNARRHACHYDGHPIRWIFLSESDQLATIPNGFVPSAGERMHGLAVEKSLVTSASKCELCCDTELGFEFTVPESLTDWHHPTF